MMAIKADDFDRLLDKAWDAYRATLPGGNLTLVYGTGVAFNYTPTLTSISGTLLVIATVMVEFLHMAQEIATAFAHPSVEVYPDKDET